MTYLQMAAQKGGARFETTEKCGEEVGRILLIKTNVFGAAFLKGLRKVGKSDRKYLRTESMSS